MENIREQIEDKVIDCINSGAGGRLIIFKPEKDPFGADLVVERRGKYKEKEMHFQINSLVVPIQSDNFSTDFPLENFKADKNFYLIFAYFDDVKQKINDYVWLLPSLQLKDIGDVIKLPGGRKILRFQSSSDFKNKNKYSKFIIDIRELGKILLDAFEKGGKFDFKESVKGAFEEKKQVNLDNLKEFLFTARENTYAAGATPFENPRLAGSIQLEFQKGEYLYRDIFFNGEKKYIGQEIVYQDSKPIWGMNYIGSQIGKLETAFLKESLLELVEKCRIGGVCEYEKRDLKYQDRGQGDLAEFSGTEEIFHEGKSIYTLNYQGGLISQSL